MTPVKQTIGDADAGNCLTACIASILDLPIGEVPNFAAEHGDDCLKAAERWLRGRGYGFVSVGFASYETFANTYFENNGEYCVLCGPSTYPNRGHATVGRVNEHGGIEIVHNPHSEGGPLPIGHRWVRFIVKA